MVDISVQNLYKMLDEKDVAIAQHLAIITQQQQEIELLTRELEALRNPSVPRRKPAVSRWDDEKRLRQRNEVVANRNWKRDDYGW